MPKKDPFEDLDQDFKEDTEAMDEAQLRDRITKIALDQEALMEAKGNDVDLAEKRESASVAGACYREGTKANKLRMKWLRLMLDGKGKDTGSFEQS